MSDFILKKGSEGRMQAGVLRLSRTAVLSTRGTRSGSMTIWESKS